MPAPYLDLLKLASPEAIVVLAALVVLALGLTNRGRATGAGVSADKPEDKAPEPFAAKTLSSFVGIVGIALAIFAITRLPAHSVLFKGMLVISPLTSLFKSVCLILAFFAILLAQSDKSLRNHAEYVALLLFATLGLMLLVGSEELLTLFIGLELLSLSLYVMTAFDKTNIRGAEAGMKYFLFGSTTSAFTLFGISLIYGLSGATVLGVIGQKLGAAPISPLLAAGIIMTLIGFAFKVAAAPFHLWAPDAYQAGPVPSAAFIASGSKVASFVVLGKIMLVGFNAVRGSADWHAMVAGWTPLLAVLAALSMLLGTFVALAQRNVRRLLAYSAVAHAGYTLLGIIAGGREGFSATLFYTTVYAFTLIGAFGVCGVVRRETGGDDLTNFVGLWSRRRTETGFGIAAAAMAVFMLSLAGLPPFPGFFGKFYLFSAAFRAGANHGLLWLVAIALFASLISLYYYLMVLKAVFVTEPEHAAEERAIGPTDWLQSTVIAVVALLVVFLGLAPSVLIGRILASLS